jgi:D-beta-D-heptose 7-phosphate kinase/D-beta-D-heptose 1-phosphate adenosyltransferase
MFFRVDSMQKIERVDISKINFDYDAIVISDYNKGFLTTEDISYICDNHSNVFIDTKKTLGDWIRKAKFIKLNDVEYENSKQFLTKELSEKIIHTMGGLGCEHQGKIYPTKKVEVKDLSGAGDTFISAFVVKFLKNNHVGESIRYANQCASKVVSQRGVTTI